MRNVKYIIKTRKGGTCKALPLEGFPTSRQ